MVDDQGQGLRAVRIAPASTATATSGEDEEHQHFQWTASRYSAVELRRARHPYELVPSSDTVYWRLDIETAGVGTGACGPGVLEKYQVPCREVEFGFRLDPLRP